MLAPSLTPKELELVELLKTQDMTRGQAHKHGYEITNAFLIKCEQHDVLLYEYDVREDNKPKIKYGVMKEVKK